MDWEFWYENQDMLDRRSALDYVLDELNNMLDEHNQAEYERRRQ